MITKKVVTGTGLIFLGLLFFNTNLRFPGIREIDPGNNGAQLLIGTVLIIVGVIQIKKLLNEFLKNKKVDEYYNLKPNNTLLDVLGLE